MLLKMLDIIGTISFSNNFGRELNFEIGLQLAILKQSTDFQIGATILGFHFEGNLPIVREKINNRKNYLKQNNRS